MSKEGPCEWKDLETGNVCGRPGECLDEDNQRPLCMRHEIASVKVRDDLSTQVILEGLCNCGCIIYTIFPATRTDFASAKSNLSYCLLHGNAPLLLAEAREVAKQYGSLPADLLPAMAGLKKAIRAAEIGGDPIGGHLSITPIEARALVILFEGIDNAGALPHELEAMFLGAKGLLEQWKKQGRI